jgi:hypothetical protein
MRYDPVSETINRPRAVLAVMLAGCFAVVPSVHASTFLTGNVLLEQCQERSAGCVGYVLGIADAIAIAQELGGALAGWRACLPPGVSGEQAVEVVVRFLTNYPDLGDLSAATLTARALAEAFPCPE